MPHPGIPVTVSAAVEGHVDEAVLRSVFAYVGVVPGGFYGKHGKDHLRLKLSGYNNAAHNFPWVIIVDLDHDAACAPDLVRAWLPVPAPLLCFRVAVREVESWLLADRERIANFLGVARSAIPANPDDLADPKRRMVEIANCSRSNQIRADMVPRSSSGRNIGPAYSSRMIEFISLSDASWRPDVAQTHSDSLRRCISSLLRLKTQVEGR